MPAYRNRPDRRKAKLLPTLAGLPIFTYTLDNPNDGGCTIVFPAPVQTNQADLANLDVEAIGVFIFDGTSNTLMGIALAALSEDRVSLDLTYESAVGGSCYVYFSQNQEGLYGPNGEVIDTTPHPYSV